MQDCVNLLQVWVSTALIAVGFHWFLNVSKVPNLAYGDIAVASSYGIAILAPKFGYAGSACIAILCATLLSAVLFAGVFSKLGIDGPLLLASWSLSVAVSELLRLEIGPSGIAVPAIGGGLSIPITSSASLAGPYAAIILGGSLLVILSWWYLERSRVGLGDRSAMNAPKVAASMGLRARRSRWRLLSASGAFAGCIGLLITPTQAVSPLTGTDITLRAYYCMIASPSASVGGVVVGALIVGSLRYACDRLWSGSTSVTIFFATLVITIVVRTLCTRTHI